MSKFASVADFLALLPGAKKAGSNEWKAHCPCGQNHKNGDATESLFVSFDGSNQKILVHCQTGCGLNEICSALGCSVADLNLSAGGGHSLGNFLSWYASQSGLKTPVAYSYCYGRFADGLHKVRFVDAEGNKTFRWLHTDTSTKSGYRMNRGNCPHRLFVDGDPSAVEYFIAEGEKDVQTLHRLTGKTAACSENGASTAQGKKWRAEYNEQLRGKSVYLLFDNDATGKAFADIEREQILKVASRLVVLDLAAVWPEIPEKGDISDMVAALGDAEALSRLNKLIESTAAEEKPLQNESQAAPPSADPQPDTTSANPQPDYPAWFDHGRINELKFVEAFAEKTGWQKTGRTIRTADGQIVSADAARKVIAEEIAPLFPTDTQRRIESLFKLLRVYLPEAKAADAFEPISAWDLSQQELKPPEFTVDQLLPVGLTVFAAPPKTGKSWFCLALADAIASGKPFMGFATKGGSVLYAALEDTRYRIVTRLRKIGSVMPRSLKIVVAGAKRIDDGLQMQLESWIDKTPDARLIVIDTLARVKPLSATGLDAYTSDSATIAPLQSLALQRDVSIVLITHFSKARQLSADADPFERITGSSGLFGVADAAWLIYGQRGGAEMTFRITGRDAMDNEFRVSFNSQTCRWGLLGTSEALEEQRRIDGYRTSPIAETIKEVIAEKGRWEVTATELSVEVAKRKQVFIGSEARVIGKQIVGIMDLLAKDGIVCVKLPGGRKGRGYCFELANRMF